MAVAPAHDRTRTSRAGRRAPHDAPSGTPARRLIVSADDFGLSRGVNAAVVEGHTHGILTNAGLMVTGVAAADAVDQARAMPTLAVGLHLVLVQGRAASPRAAIPDLVDPDGFFPPRPVEAGMHYFFRPRVRAQVEHEVCAQLERFLATGLPLSHVDGHLNLHVHPVVVATLCRVARWYGIRALRLPREPLALSLRLDPRWARRKRVESVIFRTLSAWAEPRLRAAGIASADRMFGLHQTGHVVEDHVLGLLGALPSGTTELYTHAAHTDAESARWRPAHYECEAELAALTSPRVRAALHAGAIDLISYRDLAG